MLMYSKWRARLVDTVGEDFDNMSALLLDSLLTFGFFISSWSFLAFFPLTLTLTT